MRKLPIEPTEIFKGVQDDFYNQSHFLPLNSENTLPIKFKDFYFNSLTNPKQEDSELIKKWVSSSNIKLVNEFIPCYKGYYDIPLNYALMKNGDESLLVIVGSEETQPMIYRICIEEVWLI